MNTQDLEDVARIRAADHSTRDETYEIDWRFLAYRRDFGNVTVMLGYDYGSDVPDAVLMLSVPSWDEKKLEAGEYPPLIIIPRAAAWKWSRTTNNDAEMVGMAEGAKISGEHYQRANAIYYCSLLDLDPHIGNQINRVRSLIEDHLGDLISMPPAPDRDDPEAVATFSVMRLSTGTTEEVTVRLQ